MFHYNNDSHKHLTLQSFLQILFRVLPLVKVLHVKNKKKSHFTLRKDTKQQQQQIEKLIFLFFLFLLITWLHPSLETNVRKEKKTYFYAYLWFLESRISSFDACNVIYERNVHCVFRTME